MGKFCSSVLGIGIAGAAVFMSVYMMMPDRDQRHIQKGMRDAVDDLKEITEKLTQIV